MVEWEIPAWQPVKEEEAVNQEAHTRLAIEGGRPVRVAPFPAGAKHSLAEWRAIKPIFERGTIHMTRGPEVMALREKFKKLFGMRYAVTASSGTAALHTAIGALGIGRGDEVITSPVTDMGTLIAILAQNAVPVFADVDPLTVEITPETVALKITPRTKAVILVHLAGLPADGRGIVRLARSRGIAVVDDMAQSYLCKQGRRYAGTQGDIGCWSLNESKHIGAGDGGVLLMNRRSLARRADLFADKCYDREGRGVQPFFAPFNYRLNTLVAGVCLEQLKKVRRVCAARNRLGRYLDRELTRIDGITPRPVRKGDYATYWYYLFHISPEKFHCTNAEFAAAMRAEGVPSRALYAERHELADVQGSPAQPARLRGRLPALQRRTARLRHHPLSRRDGSPAPGHPAMDERALHPARNARHGPRRGQSRRPLPVFGKVRRVHLADHHAGMKRRSLTQYAAGRLSDAATALRRPPHVRPRGRS